MSFLTLPLTLHNGRYLTYRPNRRSKHHSGRRTQHHAGTGQTYLTQAMKCDG